MPFLLRNATADGPGEAVVVRAADAGRRFAPVVTGTAAVSGTFGGATVRLEVQLSTDGPWHVPDGATFGEPGMGNLSLSCRALRAVVTGAGPTTDVTVEFSSPEISEVL